MINKEVNNGEEYGEIAELLGRLERVNAPADFDFRVKARIASGRPAAAIPFGVPAAARYAALLAVLLVVGGTAGYYVLDIGKSEIAATPVTLPADPPVLTNNGPSDTDLAIADPQPANPRPDSNGVANLTPGERDAAMIKPQTNSGDTGGGSIDQAANVGRRIMPPGINPGGIRPVTPGEFAPGSRIAVTDVLSMLGVIIRAEGSAWTVESVTQSSSAARAGLRSGDVIDSINDQKITVNSSLKNPFTAKSLRVIRDGSPVTIDLSQQ